MKILVLGCNGMLGHMLSLYLKEQGYEVVGLARGGSELIPAYVGDIKSKGFIENVLKEDNFDLIINCTVIWNKGSITDSIWVNSYFPHLLEELTKDTNTKIIQISTDYVFSGNKGNYTEEDIPDNNTIYGRTKALGELNNDKDLTLRLSVVGPDMNLNGSGLLNFFLTQEKEVNGFTGALWTGVTSLQIAKMIPELINYNGILNLVPDHIISKYELLKLFNKYMRNDSIKVNAVDKSTANTTLKQTHSLDIPDYEIMVKELADWVNNHKELYPHYFKEN